MSLHACAECGYETVAEDAEICPQCHTRQHKVYPAWVYLLSIPAAIVAAVFVFGIWGRVLGI